MKPIDYLFISLVGYFTVSNIAIADPMEKGMAIIDYGYAKFTDSPYSGSIAVTPFNSKDGMDRFENSKYKLAYFKLVPHYAPQQHITTCGIASSIMLLNTVYAENKLTPPVSVTGSWVVPEEKEIYANVVWTEDNFFNSKINSVLSRDVVEGKIKVGGKYDVGVGLDKLARVLTLQGLQAEAHHVDQVSSNSLDQFRSLIKQITANASQYMMLNYNLLVASEIDGGHFSPVGAYDETSDSVLVLDTWSAFAPWVWINIYDLYQSMHTMDGKTYRGYILVNAKTAEKTESTAVQPKTNLNGLDSRSTLFYH
jgi:hypothetical protein